MNRTETIYKIIEHSDDEVLRDYAYSHLDTWNDESLKEQVENIDCADEDD